MTAPQSGGDLSRQIGNEPVVVLALLDILYEVNTMTCEHWPQAPGVSSNTKGYCRGCQIGTLAQCALLELGYDGPLDGEHPGRGSNA